MVDRVGLNAWRALLQSQADVQPSRLRPSIVHLIARSSRWSGIDDSRAVSAPQPAAALQACWLPCMTSTNLTGCPGAPRALLIQSPRSRAGFLSLGDYHGQLQAAQRQTLSAVQQLQEQMVKPQVAQTG